MGTETEASLLLTQTLRVMTRCFECDGVEPESGHCVIGVLMAG